MESTIQIILIICVVSLTAIFVTAGVWVILILREIRRAAEKVSKIGDDVEETSHFVKQKIKDGFDMMALMATLSTLWSKKEKLADVIPEIKEKMAKDQKIRILKKRMIVIRIIMKRKIRQRNGGSFSFEKSSFLKINFLC